MFVTECEADDNRAWVLKLFIVLAAPNKTYQSVLRLRLIQKPNSNSSSVPSAQGVYSSNLHSSSNRKGHHTAPEIKDGLVVHRLLTKADQILFEEVRYNTIFSCFL